MFFGGVFFFLFLEKKSEEYANRNHVHNRRSSYAILIESINEEHGIVGLHKTNQIVLIILVTRTMTSYFAPFVLDTLS